MNATRDAARIQIATMYLDSRKDPREAVDTLLAAEFDAADLLVLFDVLVGPRRAMPGLGLSGKARRAAEYLRTLACILKADDDAE